MSDQIQETGWIDSTGAIKLQTGKFNAVDGPNPLRIEFERDVSRAVILATARNDEGTSDASSCWVQVYAESAHSILFTLENPQNASVNVGVQFVVFD